ncbi:MAG: hypothetical protein GVY33_01510 [Alphaproteobacteria bacterium]|jgi:hypothetical protein|nr:hypothetical protein [Alphaproteobacteria bacterium]
MRSLATPTLIAVIVGTTPSALAIDAPKTTPVRWGMLVYGGVLTAGDWKEALRPDRVEFEDSQLVGVGVSYTYARPWQQRIDLEVEGAVIKHFGLQEHVEFTAVPLAARWRRFPWDAHLATSLGVGGGFSYAARPPAAEIEVGRQAEQLLFHWYIEAAAGPPERRWEAIFRLHHRSGGFGLLAPQGGSGSDFLTLGVRRRF